MHAGRTGNALLWGEGSEKKSITSEVRGHQVLPLVQIRHPGLRSLLHDHLAGESKNGMKTMETNLVFFLPRPTVSPFEVSLTSPRNIFPFLILSYKYMGKWAFLERL